MHFPLINSFVTGVIEHEKLNSFERVLWRVTRGNLFMKTSPIEEKIEDPKTVHTPLTLTMHSPYRVTCQELSLLMSVKSSGIAIFTDLS